MNTLRIYIVGVGGQGNVLASKMIGEAALSMGVPVLMSETHGMACLLYTSLWITTCFRP